MKIIITSNTSLWLKWNTNKNFTLLNTSVKMDDLRSWQLTTCLYKCKVITALYTLRSKSVPCYHWISAFSTIRSANFKSWSFWRVESSTSNRADRKILSSFENVSASDNITKFDDHLRNILLRNSLGWYNLILFSVRYDYSLTA